MNPLSHSIISKSVYLTIVTNSFWLLYILNNLLFIIEKISFLHLTLEGRLKDHVTKLLLTWNTPNRRLGLFKKGCSEGKIPDFITLLKIDLEEFFINNAQKEVSLLTLVSSEDCVTPLIAKHVRIVVSILYFNFKTWAISSNCLSPTIGKHILNFFGIVFIAFSSTHKDDKNKVAKVKGVNNS